MKTEFASIYEAFMLSYVTYCPAPETLHRFICGGVYYAIDYVQQQTCRVFKSLGLQCTAFRTERIASRSPEQANPDPPQQTALPGVLL